MNNPTKDGGPASPVADISKTQCPGMTLRDWFAGHANETDILKHQSTPYGEVASREEARYLFADAMLAAKGAAQ